MAWASRCARTPFWAAFFLPGRFSTITHDMLALAPTWQVEDVDERAVGEMGVFSWPGLEKRQEEVPLVRRLSRGASRLPAQFSPFVTSFLARTPDPNDSHHRVEPTPSLELVLRRYLLTLAQQKGSHLRWARKENRMVTSSRTISYEPGRTRTSATTVLCGRVSSEPSSSADPTMRGMGPRRIAVLRISASLRRLSQPFISHLAHMPSEPADRQRREWPVAG